MNKKKKHMLCTFLLFILLSSVALGSNLYTNSGFEELDGNRKPVDWPSMPAVFTVDESISFLGQNSIHVDLESGNSFFNRTVTIDSDKTYFFSVWVRTQGGRARFKAEWVGGGEESSPYFTTSDEWDQFTWKLTPPPGSTELRILFRFYGPGKAWFDEAYLGERPEQLLKPITEKITKVSEADSVLDLCLRINPFPNMNNSDLKVIVKEKGSEDILVEQSIAQGPSKGVQTFQIPIEALRSGIYDMLIVILDSNNEIIEEQLLGLEVSKIIDIGLVESYLFLDEQQIEIKCTVTSDFNERELFSIEAKLLEEDKVITKGILDNLTIGENSIYIAVKDIDPKEYKLLVQILKGGQVWGQEQFNLTLMRREEFGGQWVVQEDIRTVKVGSNNELLVNEQLFVMNAMYNVPVDHFPEVREWGFNTVSLQGEHLNVAHRYNLRGLVNLGFPENDIEQIKATVLRYKDHPAVLMWLISDDVDISDVPPEEILAVYHLVHELDPNHPVTFAVFSPDNYLRYGNSLDVLTASIFPVPQHSLTQVSEKMNMAKEAVGYKTPIIPMLQSFEGVEDLQREPTEIETRGMLYLSIINGANSFSWYCFEDTTWFLPDSPNLWSSFKKLNAELAALNPIIAADDSSRLVTAEGFNSNNIQFCLKEDREQFYLIAVNTKLSTAKVNFTIEDLEENSTGEILFSPAKTVINTGSFGDVLEGHATRVYKFKKQKPVDKTKRTIEVEPNLYNPKVTSCQIRISSSEDLAKVDFIIFDLAGREINSISGMNFQDGFISFWDGTGKDGEFVANGLYVIRAKATSNSGETKYLPEVQKIIISR